MKILIIGGGIAGLSIARLLQHTHHVHLIEKQSVWQVSGTGLYTPSNGVVALEKMGLGEISKATGFRIDTRHLMDSSGKSSLKIDLEKVWGREKPCLGISRKALHEILLDGLDNIVISMGTTAEKINPAGRRTQVEFSNGHREMYDLVIGADGLFSQARKLIFGDVPLRTVYHSVCRFVVSRPENFKDWTLVVGSKGHIAMIPISKDEVYCYVCNNKAKKIEEEAYLEPFYDFIAPVPALLELRDPNNTYWDAVQELRPLDHYGKSRVVLIGDAAHGMPPLMAQGGSLAMEDALVLTSLLKGDGDLTELVAHFTNRRKDRIEWTRKRNNRRERLSKLPFWLAKRGMKLMGEKPWVEDYRPLAQSPEW